VKPTDVALDAAHLSEVENHHAFSSHLEGAKMGEHFSLHIIIKTSQRSLVQQRL
jgi:hypothetical protein